MKGLLDLFGSSIFAALLSCAFRCALDSFNNRNRAKRDYKIVEKKIRNDFLLYLESNILVRIEKKKNICARMCVCVRQALAIETSQGKK